MELPGRDRGTPPIIQVHVLMLPSKKRKWKTKVQRLEQPIFNEQFRVSGIPPTEVDRLGLRFRLKGICKVKDRLIGEAIIDLKELSLGFHQKNSCCPLNDSDTDSHHTKKYLNYNRLTTGSNLFIF